MKTNSVMVLILSVFVGIIISTSPCFAATRYVDGSISSSGAGTSWATAKKTIQEAVTAASPYDQIWVRAGTYALASTITLNKSVFLFGGFSGTETALAQRNLKTNVTTVDGQNARQCISITSDYVTVDGFSITRGYATGATQSTYGSGIYINVYSGTGGLYSGTYTSVANCKIYSNTNVSALYMYAFTGTISNCMIYRNTALYDGAGIMVHQSQSTIINCTVVYNTGTNGSGGGIYVLGSNYTPGAKIINTIVWNNTAPTGANLYAVSSGTLSVSYSSIQGGYTGIGNNNIAPGFVSAGTNNFHLAPAAACCVDKGGSISPGYNITTDFEGDPRIVGIYADIGADEYFVASAPTVTTTIISGLTTTSATSGGNVTADGGSTVTERGVCWSTAASPTVAGSHTSDGTGTGSYASALSSLNPATGYHLRAYATNSAGTAYGSEVDFTTDAPLNVMLQGKGTGAVVITPPATTCNSGTCSATYTFGTPVTLTYSTADHTLFDGWSGDCTNTSGSCNIIMDSIKAILASFSIDSGYAVWIDPGTMYYFKIGDAYQNASSGTSIKACKLDFTENLNFDQIKSITLSGGYSSDYSRIEGMTGVGGTVTIQRGAMTVENLVVK